MTTSNLKQHDMPENATEELKNVINIYAENITVEAGKKGPKIKVNTEAKVKVFETLGVDKDSLEKVEAAIETSIRAFNVAAVDAATNHMVENKDVEEVNVKYHPVSFVTHTDTIRRRNDTTIKKGFGQDATSEPVTYYGDSNPSVRVGIKAMGADRDAMRSKAEKLLKG